MSDDEKRKLSATLIYRFCRLFEEADPSGESEALWPLLERVEQSTVELVETP